MAKTLKRVLSALLVLCMFVGLLPQITIDFSVAKAAASNVYYDFSKANTGSYGADAAARREYFASLTYDKVASLNSSITSGKWAYHSYSCESPDSTPDSTYAGYYYEQGIGFAVVTTSRKQETKTAVKLKVENAGKYIPFLNIHGGYFVAYAGVITANFRAINSDGSLGETLASKKIHTSATASPKSYVALSDVVLELSATEYALEIIVDNERVAVLIDGLHLRAAESHIPVSYVIGNNEGYVEVNVGETVTMPIKIMASNGKEYPYEGSSNYGYTTNNAYVTLGVDKTSKTVSFTGVAATDTPQTVEFTNGYAKAKINVVVKPEGYKKPVETLYYDFKKVLPDYVTVNNRHNMTPLLTYAMSTTGAYGEINKWTGTATDISIDSDPWYVASIDSGVIFSPLFHNYGIANKKQGVTDVKIKVPVGGVYQPYLNIPTAYPMNTPLTISVINSDGTTLSTQTLAAGTSGARTAIASNALVLPKGEYVVRFNKTEAGSSSDAGANYYDGIELVPQSFKYDFEKANTGTYAGGADAIEAEFKTLTYDKVASLNSSVSSAPWAYHSYEFNCKEESSPDSHITASFVGYNYENAGFAVVPSTRKQETKVAVKLKAAAVGKFIPVLNVNGTYFPNYAGVITASLYKLSNGALGTKLASKQFHLGAYPGKDNYIAISDTPVSIDGGEYALEIFIDDERTIAIIDDFELVPAEAKTPVSITIGNNEGLVEVNAGEAVSVHATVLMSDGTKLNFADSSDWEYTTGNSYVTLGVDKSGKFTFTGVTATSSPQTVYFKNGSAVTKINVKVNAAGTTKVAEDLYYDFTKVLPDTVTANGAYNMGKYITYAMSTPGAFGEINKWTGAASNTSVDSDPWMIASLDSTIKFSPCFHNYGIKSINKGVADVKIKVPVAGNYRPYLSIGTPYPTGSALTMSFLDSNGTVLSTRDIAVGSSGDISLSDAPLDLKAGEYIVRFNKTEVGTSTDAGANFYDGIHLYNIIDSGNTDIVYDFKKAWSGDTTADYVKTITYDMTTSGSATELNPDKTSAPWAFLADDSTGGNSYFKYNYASYGLCKSLKGTATLKIKVPATGYYIPSVNLYNNTKGDATVTLKKFDASTGTVGDKIAQLVTAVSATETKDYSFGGKVFLAKGEYALEITAANVSGSAVIINNLTLKATDSAELGSIDVDLKANYYNDTIGFYPSDTSLNVDDIKVTLYSTTGEDITESAILGENYTATFKSSDTSVATIDSNGHIVAKKLGTTTITATVTLNGVTKTASYTFSVVTGGKNRRSYYREDKVAAMRENATKYSFAKNTMNNAVKNSAKFIENPEKLWNSVTSQELPRSYYTTYRADPAYSKCHYCGCDLVDEYGSPYYAWKIDAWNNPWKITCPDCNRNFPSNDFGSFYNLGINPDGGEWSYELAKSENAKLVSAGKSGYLVNTAYPEKGTGWGVDDGYGYVSGTTFKAPNGDTVNSTHTYISFYNHWGVWHTSLLYNAVGNLRNAYIYTGDIKYGRVGAVLIDRIADVYPEMTTAPYRYQFTDSANYAPQGKVSDYIWENQLAEQWAGAYDAFWPAYEDSEVISTLSAHAKKYNMANDKSTAAKIRKNCEDGILREIFKCTQNGKIGGNFGMYQSTLAIAAVALDTEPETIEMLDWIFRDGEQLMVDGAVQVNKTTGGNVNRQLFDAVDTNGIPDEVAPNYNQLWVESLYELVDYLAGYDKYPECDLYNNPKYMKMNKVVPELLIRRWAMPQIGDSGATAKDEIKMLKDNNRYVHGFMYTKDPIFAQVLYMYNGFKSTGLHYPADHPDPMSLADDVQEIIDRDGLFDYDKSRMLTDYGYAATRFPTINDNLETQTTYWMFFGRGAGHGHRDALNLGIDAKGLAVAPDLGYPTSTSGYEYASWGQTTTSHNTVVVNDGRQFRLRTTGFPHHFDDSGRVKVMDASAEHQYSIEDYRRTVVSIGIDEDDTYAVDFFHVNGGNEHLYSFHALADTVTTKNLTLTPQTDSSGNYVGTYSGADVPFATYESRQIGYSYLYNVDRDENVVGGNFTVDFQIEDYRGVRDTVQDTHLKMTMINGFDLNEVALADGNAPKRDLNPEKLKFVLARRSGTNLNSLFTTVFETYNDNSNISSISAVTVKRADGSSMTSDEKVRSVKVVLKNGRTDYITFANKTDVEYNVDNLFNVKGFVTVYSLENGVNTYSYVNDGTKVGSLTTTAAYTGKIKDFTKGSKFENSLTVTFDGTVDVENLVGRYLYVDEEALDKGNSTYEILGVTKSGSNYILDIGDITLIDKLDENGDYVYMVDAGDTFRVPLSAVKAESKVTLAAVSNKTVTAGSEVEFNLAATSSMNLPITYAATNLPTGATLDPSTGAFSWTPTTSQIGDHTVNFTASDAYGTGSLAVKIKVNANTSTVALDAGNSVTATYGQAMPSITPPKAAGKVFAGYFDGTNGSGNQYYKADGSSAKNWDKTGNVTLYAKWNNATVTLADPGAKSVIAGNKLTFTVSGSTNSGMGVTYSATNLPGGATFSGSTFTWTPELSQIGTHTATIAATDGAISATKTLTITVEAPKATVSLSVGGTVEVTYGQPMPEISVPTRDGYIFGGYYDEANGEGNMYYKADGTGARNWDKAGTATLYANWIKGEVTITQIEDKTVLADEKLSFKVEAESTAPGTITYTAENLPEGATFNAATGEFSWTPTVAQAGEYTITFKGSDGVSYAQVTVKVSVVTLASRVTLSEGGSVDAVYGQPLQSITPPGKDGYIFDGYYDDKDVKYYNADGTGARVWDKSGDATLHAKWVEGSDIFGTTGVFMRNIKLSDGQYQIHIFSGIDGIKYKEVGFEVIAGGKTLKLSTTTVFKSIVANNGTVTPGRLGSKCQSLFAQTIVFSADKKDEAVTYRPYAVDKKGNYIYGKYVTIDKIYNK